jgi:hypothetical protein
MLTSGELKSMGYKRTFLGKKDSVISSSANCLRYYTSLLGIGEPVRCGGSRGLKPEETSGYGSPFRCSTWHHRALGLVNGKIISILITNYPLPITNDQLPITSLRDSISIQANMILKMYHPYIDKQGAANKSIK